MVQSLKCGVAGAGVFGGHHARKYAQIAGATLAAVYDPSLERAKALAEPLGATGYDELDSFLAAIDVATIAAPALAQARRAIGSRAVVLTGTLTAGGRTYGGLRFVWSNGE